MHTHTFMHLYTWLGVGGHAYIHIYAFLHMVVGRTCIHTFMHLYTWLGDITKEVEQNAINQENSG